MWRPTRAARTSILMRVAFCAAIWAAVGCSGGADTSSDGSTWREHPTAGRFASAKSPFEVAEDASIPTDILRQATDGSTTRHQRPLLAVAHLPRHLAVVYPAASGGLSVATTGLDAPWESVPLLDLEPTDVDALVATGDPEGRFHVLVRHAGMLRHWTWKPGGTPRERKGLPSVTIPSSADGSYPCPDLSAAPNPTGGIGLVFQRQTDDGGRHPTYAGWRAAQGWTVEKMEQTFQQPSFDLGCGSDLSFTRGGEPVAIVLGRWLPYDSPNDTRANAALVKRWLQATRGADGLWHQLPGQNNASADAALYGTRVGLARHPTGVILMGPSMSMDMAADRRESLAVEPLPADSFWRRENGPSQRQFRTPSGAFQAGALKAGDTSPQLFINACGGVGFHVGGPQPVFVLGASRPCYFQPRAPVLRFRDAQPGGGPVEWGRGPVDYSAGACRTSRGRLAICRGGHPVDADSDAPLALRDGELPTRVSATPAHGTSDVDPTRRYVSIQLKHAPPADATLRAVLWDVDAVSRADEGAEVMMKRAPSEDPTNIRFRLTDDLVPGHHYRLELKWTHTEADGTSRPLFESWEFTDRAPPVVEFQTGGSARDLVDLRDQSARLYAFDAISPYGNTGNERTGGLMAPFEMHWRVVTTDAPEAAPVSLGLDWGKVDPADFRLEAPDGSRAPVQFRPVSNTPGASVRIAAREPLKPETTYVMTVPPNLVDLLGRQPPLTKRQFEFRTTSLLPHLVSSYPTTGGSGLPIDTPIYLEFNVPIDVAIARERSPFTVGLRRSNGGTVNSRLVRHEGTKYELEHPPLAPGTTYEVILGNQLVAEDGRAVAQTPAIIQFSTAKAAN